MRMMFRNWPAALGILFLYAVGVWGLLECMEREDRIAQLETHEAQMLMTESYR